jgi:hypothetical protein
MNLNELISSYTAKKWLKIEKVLEPLTTVSGITGFFH